MKKPKILKVFRTIIMKGKMFCKLNGRKLNFKSKTKSTKSILHVNLWFVVLDDIIKTVKVNYYIRQSESAHRHNKSRTL